jgi:hypothetical protein
MCGVLPVLLGTIAFMGTLTVRFQAPVPMGERLIGRAKVDGRELRKRFVSATLSSSVTGAELAKASMIMLAAQADQHRTADLRSRRHHRTSRENAPSGRELPAPNGTSVRVRAPSSHRAPPTSRGRLYVC